MDWTSKQFKRNKEFEEWYKELIRLRNLWEQLDIKAKDARKERNRYEADFNGVFEGGPAVYARRTPLFDGLVDDNDVDNNVNLE